MVTPCEWGCPWVVVLLHAKNNMLTNIQTTDYPYPPTTNTPLLTTHHTLIVCEAVRSVCPCDDDRDAKEDDFNIYLFYLTLMFWHQTNLAETVTKCDDISAEKTEAIDQCPGWIVFAVDGSYARGLLR